LRSAMEAKAVAASFRWYFILNSNFLSVFYFNF
jgi:hypothetical protein